MSGAWSWRLEQDDRGRCAVVVLDEDGEAVPVARDMTEGQAEKLVLLIQSEANREAKPMKAVVRDPYFMAATVLMVKRQPL